MPTITPVEDITLTLPYMDENNALQVEQFTIRAGVNLNTATLQNKLNNFMAKNANNQPDVTPKITPADLVLMPNSDIKQLMRKLAAAGKITIS